VAIAAVAPTALENRIHPYSILYALITQVQHRPLRSLERLIRLKIRDEELIIKTGKSLLCHFHLDVRTAQ